MGRLMELRRLRYFVAAAKEGSLTVAAVKRLHTAQPSLSRQMRDLEDQVGVPLMSSKPRRSYTALEAAVLVPADGKALGRIPAMV
jgi:DNA-binding transcriptional LysR family regulator